MAYLIDEKTNTSLTQKTVRVVREILHLVPFFLGFALSRFYEISFTNDIFLIGILVSAVMLFCCRDKVNEPPYKEDDL